MGSKGNRNSGEFARDYNNHVSWVSTKSKIRKIKDINYIEQQCVIKFTSTVQKK